MDTSEYMPMFLAEARSTCRSSTWPSSAWRRSRGDRETVDEIFRAAHSLKGMSATMGFAEIAKLTHEMEDVFELLRQRGEGLTREAIDVLACLDALTASLTRSRPTARRPLTRHRWSSACMAWCAPARPSRSSSASRPRRCREVVLDIAARQRVLHVVAVLDDQVLMPAVRAHMVFSAWASMAS